MYGKSKRTKSGVAQSISRLTYEADGTAGAALVEFAVAAPLLVLIVTALMDFGLLVFQQIEVQHAAQAGAQYIITSMASANGYSSSDISSAVTNATTFTQISASPTPFQFCGCPSSTGVQQPKSCSQANCTTGTLGTYVTVSAQATYSPIVISSIFTHANRTLSASATVRIQ